MLIRTGFKKQLLVSLLLVGMTYGVVSAQTPQQHQFNGPYKGEHLDRIAFPIGGMGAGMYCLEGTGYFSHMSVRNRPEMFHEPSMFAAIHVKGIENGSKLLEGPVVQWRKTGLRGGFGIDPTSIGSTLATYGFPHFTQAEFSARFPFAQIELKDNDIPIGVTLKGWSPFIPTDADNSSLPAGILEYTLENKSGKTLETVFSFNTRNFLQIRNKGVNSIKSIDNGFVLSQTGSADEPFLQSEFAIFTDQPNTVVNHCWFRGSWFDGITMAWNSIKKGHVDAVAPVDKDAPGASLYVPVTLKAGEKKTIKVYTVWYVPETYLRFWGNDPADLKDNFAEKTYTGDEHKTHRPWYSSKFANAKQVASYMTANYDKLYRNSKTFSDAFYNTTLPAEVVEAVAANLTILKSPTVLRQADGRMWNWEGSADEWGSCHGSCTHVWNYAQAVSHLFPSLERSLRETEFGESQKRDGHQAFRSNLPIRPVVHDFYAAADGQLGGIMKVYRDWRIFGDKKWLTTMYPKIKASIDYCIKTWDPAGKGTIEEPHHNTYDIEFWGSDGMHNSFYMGALMAIEQMGKYLGEDVSKYEKLYAKGKKFTESELFNGEYFIQKIQWSGLQVPDPVAASKSSIGGGYSTEAVTLLQKEGPKYQYGSGCLSDGVFGSSLARMCGLPEPLDVKKTKSHLLSVHKYNLRKTLINHDNPQRPAFGFGDDGGLLLCTWPKGDKLSLPFVYSDEVWTGIEYQVASHLMFMGEVDKALDIVRLTRSRYNGKNRNPFNEIECGNWYARAMASYGMIQGMTGVRYDAVDKILYVDSKVGDFKSFISTDTGFGTVTYKKGKPSIEVVYGTIEIDKYVVSGNKM